MPKSSERVKQRHSRGASIFILVLLLCQLLLLIDFCAFNLVRLLTAQRQINTVCEAAALAGTSKLSKIDLSKYNASSQMVIKNQKIACAEAENILLREHVLSGQLNTARRVNTIAELTDHLAPGESRFCIKLADSSAGYNPVEFGNPAGKTISCSMAYGYQPLFLTNIVSLCCPIIGNCIGGLPLIDSVIVLDISCAMDDETPVTFVRREWIHSSLGMGNYAMGRTNLPTVNPGIIQYVSLRCPTSPHTILNYLGWDYGAKRPSVGSMVNALPPQNLDRAINNPLITHEMYFDAYLRAHYPCYNYRANYLPSELTAAPFFRARDFGTPPGNCDLGATCGGNGDGVTDLAGNYRPMQAVPALNAFSDLTWQDDGQITFNYQPAAPGALTGRGDNDPIPSPDQQTFTDLVVNIANPTTSSSNGSIEQPLIGPDIFVGFSYTFPVDEPDPLLRNQTFNFANIGVLVEAARGNLEATPVSGSGLNNAQKALLDRPVSVDGNTFNMTSVGFQDGYQRAYQRLAMLFIQPLSTVIQALDDCYLERLHRLADCRFALICFSNSEPLKNHGYFDRAHTYGTSDNYSYYVFNSPYDRIQLTNAVYDSASPAIFTSTGLNNQPLEDGFGWGFRVPRIALDSKNEHYTDCLSRNTCKDGFLNNHLNCTAGSNGIYNARALSDKNFAEALETARQMFSSESYNPATCSRDRIPARRLITFITSGEVEGGAYCTEVSDALRTAGHAAQRTTNTCSSAGIAIFTLGLNLAKSKGFAELQEYQRLVLGDKEPAGGEPGGLAWRAGHGGRYYPCTDLSQIKLSLSDISSRFSQRQR